jgi:hypothetical protein
MCVGWGWVAITYLVADLEIYAEETREFRALARLGTTEQTRCVFPLGGVPVEPAEIPHDLICVDLSRLTGSQVGCAVDFGLRPFWLDGDVEVGADREVTIGLCGLYASFLQANVGPVRLSSNETSERLLDRRWRDGAVPSERIVLLM